MVGMASSDEEEGRNATVRIGSNGDAASREEMGYSGNMAAVVGQWLAPMKGVEDGVAAAEEGRKIGGWQYKMAGATRDVDGSSKDDDNDDDDVDGKGSDCKITVGTSRIVALILINRTPWDSIVDGDGKGTVREGSSKEMGAPSTQMGSEQRGKKVTTEGSR
ncbi:hypothetical protein B296_00020448 [Ensete ventricosum]|uniref:Uncharacterized protein n=1 Tax=Ensete ventricosum TaxID=4639 RepID=A0A426YQC3_ENSVE|nr:hypothetical protein B296_00020448 [Ensete ventricosum]